MSHTLEVGSCPTYEKPVQVKRDYDYLPAMTFQCRVWEKMLYRHFSPPKNTSFQITCSTHEFGQVKEVVIKYDGYSMPSIEFAFDTEKSLPTEWDEEAKKELASPEYLQLIKGMDECV